MKSQREIGKILRRVRPAEPGDLLDVLRLTELGAGCSREVFHISGSRVVIKFPMMNYGRAHARREMRVIARFRKIKPLRRYLPRILYQDYATGVIALELLRVPSVSAEECHMLADLVHDTMGTKHELDFGPGNLGYGSWGQLKILDFGCI